MVGNRCTEDRIGHEGAIYSEAIGESGTVYPMFRWCKLSKWFEYSANVFSFVYCVIMYPINLIINFILAVYHLIIYRIWNLWYSPFGYSYLYNVGIEMNIGYKNFNIKEVGVPYKYSFTVSINSFKRFEL